MKKCFFVLLIMFQQYSYAEELTVVTECNQPCNIRESDGLPDSLPTAVIIELFKLTNDSANIQVLPWARAYDLALTQKNVLIYSISKTNKRKKLFSWIGDILIERYYVWELKETNTLVTSNEAFYNSKVFATYRGSNEHDLSLIHI